MNRVFSAAAFIVLTFSGCVPWGDPPEGNIVKNEITVIQSDPESVIQSFVMACLEHNVSGRIQISADHKSRIYARQAIAEAAKIVPISASGTKKTPWLLKSFITGNGKLNLQLFHENTPVWSSFSR